MQIDCDKTIMVTLKHDDKLQDASECSFQVLPSCLMLILKMLNLSKYTHIKFYLIFLCCLDLKMLPKYELRWFSESVVQFFIFHVPLIFMVKFSAFISDVKQHNQCWMIFGLSSVLSFTLQYMVKEEYVFQLWLFLVAACWVIFSARLT